MDIAAITGLEILFAKEAATRLDTFIDKHTIYIVPGYKYNYRYCTVSDRLIIYRCETLAGDRIADDIHFWTNTRWKLPISGLLDIRSSAHRYLLKSQNGADIPVRVLCPDILPSVQIGDTVDGRVVLFADEAERLTDGCGGSGSIAADGDGTVVLRGCAENAELCMDSDDDPRAFIIFNMETENGYITVFVPADRLALLPENGDAIAVRGIISMDLAVERDPPSQRNADPHARCYTGILADADTVSYRNGFRPGYLNDRTVLVDGLRSGDLTRFIRCCRETVTCSGLDGQPGYRPIRRDGIPAALGVLLSEQPDSFEPKHILACPEERLIGHEAVSAFSRGQFCAAVHFAVDADGMVTALQLFRSGDCKVGTDHELHAYTMLAHAMCDFMPHCLHDLLSPGCVYRSEYANRCFVGADSILAWLSEIDRNIEGKHRYTSEIALTKDELAGETDESIYHGKLCAVHYFDGELAYIAFIKTDKTHRITDILLSCNPARLRAFRPTDAKSGPDTAGVPLTGILADVYGASDPVRAMRESALPDEDRHNLYVWKQADAFALSWLSKNGYEVSGTVPYEDCLGYVCSRKGTDYAFFLFAYDAETASTIDGDSCAKLRDNEISRDRDILVLRLTVEKTTDADGGAEYLVYGYGGKRSEPEPLLLTKVAGKNILRYFPRREMMELIPRLIAAFNAKDLDSLQTICTKGVYLETFEYGGRSMNDGFYCHLSAIRERYGLMRLAYIRFDDTVFNAVPYVEGFAYVSFSVNAGNRIDSVRFHALHDRFLEFLVTDEIITHCPLNEAPRLVSADFLPPSAFSRYSLLLLFESGETKRYDLDSDFGTEEVTLFRGIVMTDKIFANGRIAEHIPRYYNGYAERGQGVEFISGSALSAVELYHNGYPAGRFCYKGTDGVHVLQDGYDESGYGIGRIDGLDPRNPLYLLNERTMTAAALPDEYRDTPIYLDPFCGGYSEGLVMVSALGRLDLKYFHERSGCAGLWGWLDTELNVAIEPKYIYALNFVGGRAIVCKGTWDISVDDDGTKLYWCDKEQWGVIDHAENEIVPCRFDTVFEIDGTDRLYLVHEGGWKTGSYAVYDTEEKGLCLTLDFYFDKGYMFNDCFVTPDGILCFDEHIVGEEKDRLYLYDLRAKKWLVHGEEVSGRTLGGKTRISVNKNGKDFILF